MLWNYETGCKSEAPAKGARKKNLLLSGRAKYFCIFFCFRTFKAFIIILRKKLHFLAASSSFCTFFYVLPKLKIKMTKLSSYWRPVQWSVGYHRSWSIQTCLKIQIQTILKIQSSIKYYKADYIKICRFFKISELTFLTFLTIKDVWLIKWCYKMYFH